MNLGGDRSKFVIIKPKIAPPPLCNQYKEGFCDRGDNCNFSHVIETEPTIKPDSLLYFLERTVTRQACQYTVLRRTLEGNGFVRVIEPRSKITSPIHIYFCCRYPSNNVILPSHTLISHFPNFYELTNKACMALNLAEFDFVPKTFTLPRCKNDFLMHLQNFNNSVDLWIVKPFDSKQAVGVQILSSQEVLNKCTLNADSFLCSTYIKNPLLVQKRKIDLRLYVLVTHREQGEIYLYRNGMVRFASQDYHYDPSTRHLSNMHITNCSINRHNESAITNMSIKELDSQLEPKRIDWEPVHHLIRCAVRSTILCPKFQNEIYHSNKHRCFQLFGFDVLLDDQLRPYLLEVNNIPNMDAMSKNAGAVYQPDYDIKAKLLTDMLNLLFFNCQDGDFEKI
ncbi:hypothetical protein AKO1_005827 [Acrasis kona]|uniref:C3H1-type domain-containing protein n=1 Tax=Acrasis kona TaxID=1008807 RepID=A0AAW2YJ94_9EUKA